jgi:hypothetical protein
MTDNLWAIVIVSENDDIIWFFASVVSSFRFKELLNKNLRHKSKAAMKKSRDFQFNEIHFFCSTSNFNLNFIELLLEL